MSVSTYFSNTYAEAREQFRAAAKDAGATLDSYQNPAMGPEGEQLSTDVAWLGPQDASRVLVTLSGTHGAEGFCGSGVQVGWFRTGRARRLPKDTALLQIHAVNPFGFAWLRRTTEENVDINRNYVDFDQPLPVNEGYAKYRDLICPSQWSEQIARDTTEEINRLVEALPPKVMQGAISAGQYVDPEGIFYGGKEPSWSRRTCDKIMVRFLASARHIAMVDYHTGLGPRGYGERIGVGKPGMADWDRSNEWWGDVTSIDDGSSSSAPLNGTNMEAWVAQLSHAQVTPIVLEYGTLPLPDVLLALRADNWLHAHGDLNSELGVRIKQQARDAFYQDADDWKQMIWSRGIDTQAIALAHLARSA
ncbi:MAG: M14 family metallopeptidase [Pseudomonadota bacterium]